MPQVIVNYCDPCHGEGRSVTGEPVVVALDRTQPRLVILCESCVTSLVKPLGDVLSRWGTKVDQTLPPAKAVAKATAEGTRFVCPVEGCEQETVTQQGMRRHLRDMHAATNDGGWPCPEEGCTNLPLTRAGLVSHLASYHQTRMADYGFPLLAGGRKADNTDQLRGEQEKLQAARRAGTGVPRVSPDLGNVVERLPCPYPGCGRDAKNYGAMLQHMRQQHRVQWSDWRAEHPEYPRMSQDLYALTNWKELMAAHADQLV